MTDRLPLVRVGGKNTQIPAGDALGLRGALNEAPRLVVPAFPPGGNILDVSLYPANSLNISGSAAGAQITGFQGAVSGARRVVRNTGSVAITLRYSAALFVLPTGADIVMQPNDSTEFLCFSATGWVCLWFQRANGTALVGGSGGSFTGGKLTSDLQFADRASIAAAATTDLSSVNSNLVTISSAGTITSFGTGIVGDLKFVLVGIDNTTITRNGSTLEVPGKATITAMSGDFFIAECVAASSWRVRDYQRADGTPLVGAPDATKLPLAGGKMTGPINFANMAAVTTAPAIDVSTLATNTFSVTGSGILNAFIGSPSGSGTTRWLLFNTAGITINHSAGNLLLPGGAAIVTQAGDFAQFTLLTSSNQWRCTSYQRADGTALVGSGSTGPANTDALPEGKTNLYSTVARVLATALSGLSLVTGSAVVATDSILVAIGKLQKQITDLTSVVATKEPGVAAGTSSQYWNGLKVFSDFAASVRAAVLTGLSLSSSTPVTAADSVLTAIGKLQAQLTAYGGMFRIETIATSTVGQTSYAVPNGYTIGSIIVFFNGVLMAPADITATDGANVVLGSGALSTSDIMSVVVIGAVRAQDDALLSYTVATLPAASANTAKQRYCTNMAGGAGPVFSNGTSWLRVADNTVVTT